MINRTIILTVIVVASACVSHDLPPPNCVNVSVSFETDVKPIIEMYCQINNSGCHGMNPDIPNWSIFSEVQSHAAIIKTKTRDRSMPKIGSLTQSQIDLITCWVDNGAKDN